MLRIILVTFVFTFILGGLKAQVADTNYVDGIVYLRTTESSSLDLSAYTSGNVQLDAVISTYSIDSITAPFLGLNAELDRTFRLYFQDTFNIDQLISDLSLLPEVEYAEKAPLYRTFAEPDDVDPKQAYFYVINAYDAWDVHVGQGTVVVAVVDNAINTHHEDLINILYTNTGEIPGNGFDDDLNGYTDDVQGWDAADNDGDPNPPSGITVSSAFNHGTHCAGIAGAQSDNGKGVASLVQNVRIMPVKCTPNNSEGNTLPNAYDGVTYAIREGADIISMSWGGSSGIFITGQSIIQAGNAAGITMIAAAGNDDSSQAFYPASYPSVISVGATDNQDNRAGFSNYGSNIDVMAPGVNIYSCSGHSNNGYVSKYGTSMACPLVASLAALLLDQHPSLTPSQLETKIKQTCTNIDDQNPNYVGQIGAGRIDAYKAVVGLTTVTEFSENDRTSGISLLQQVSPFEYVVDPSVKHPSIKVANLLGQRVPFRQTGQRILIQNQGEKFLIITLNGTDTYKFGTAAISTSY